MPVLKITCSTKYHFKKIDITMYDIKHNGRKCVNLVKDFLLAYMNLKPLVLVLKHYLHQMEINDTYTVFF